MFNNIPICIGLILYNPEYTILDRIELLISTGFTVYIFDNTPEKSLIRERFKNCNTIKYITAGKNVGLGIGMSIINGQAFYDGFESLLFFDQDTDFTEETLYFVQDFYHTNKNLLIDYSSVVFNNKNVKTCDKKFCTKDVLLSISSGSLFFLNALKKIGFHNTSFFVDWVDYELCLNSDNHGLKTMECSNTPGFDHVTEQADKPYKFFGKTLMLRAYPPTRVRGTVSAGLKLTIMALSKLNFKYTYALGRSLIIYIYFQILVRILNLFQ